MNAFEILGIDARLVISEEELREAFRDAGKKVHPDAGGGDGEFAVLREAMAVLSSPSRRLRHWFELHGVEIDLRGSIAPEMMDLFAGIGSVTQASEEIIRKRNEAKSALAKALLEKQTQECRESVEEALVRLEGTIEETCEMFPVIERASHPDPLLGGRLVRDLSFLEKWKTGLRSIYVRLI